MGSNPITCLLADRCAEAAEQAPHSGCFYKIRIYERTRPISFFGGAGRQGEGHSVHAAIASSLYGGFFEGKPLPEFD